MNYRTWFCCFALAATTGCATAIPSAPRIGVAIPVRDTAPPSRPEREAPPESGAQRPYRFPKVTWEDLNNGLQVATITNTSLPIVQVEW